MLIRNAVQPLLLEPRLTAEIAAFMQSLYDSVDRQVSPAQPACRNCTSCCDFARSGLDLFVTNLEAAYFVQNVRPIPPVPDRRCPFLIPNGCSVRPVRPLGCRIYFCRPPAHYDQQLLYEETQAALKQFLNQHKLPYYYAEWIQTLRSLGSPPYLPGEQ